MSLRSSEIAFAALSGKRQETPLIRSKAGGRPAAVSSTDPHTGVLSKLNLDCRHSRYGDTIASRRHQHLSEAVRRGPKIPAPTHRGDKPVLSVPVRWRPLFLVLDDELPKVLQPVEGEGYRRLIVRVQDGEGTVFRLDLKRELVQPFGEAANSAGWEHGVLALD